MILDQLGELNPLTPSERALVEFIEGHAAEIVRLPIAEVARRTATSNATIVRFCRRLGFDGFRSFRIQLVAEIERGVGSSPSVNLNYPVSPRQSTAESLSSIAELTKEAVDGTRAVLDVHTVQAIARAINKAPLVQIYASGDSAISSEAFANLLIKVGIRCISAEHRREFMANTHAARPGEVALFASYSGEHIGRMGRAGVPHELKERGCTTVAITASTSPLPFIDHVIRFPAREGTHDKMATFYSQACIRYIYNCLYAEVWTLGYEANIRHKNSIDAKEKTIHAI